MLDTEGEKERHLLFHCHSWTPSGEFRPLKSPPLFRRPLTLLSPTPPCHPSFPATFSPSFIAPHPSLLLELQSRSIRSPPSLPHLHTSLSGFLPSFLSSFDFSPSLPLLFPFPPTLRSAFLVLPPAPNLPPNTDAAIYKLSNCTNCSGRE